MAKRDPLWEAHGNFDKYPPVLVCPHCGEPGDFEQYGKQEFETLAEWKGHMQKVHGGYTSSEVAAGLEGKEQQEQGDAGAADHPPVKVKKLSTKARELNEKLNKGLRLCVKKLMHGLDEQEKKDLDIIIGVITEAVIGVEFDFEERIFKLSGKWALITALVILYIVSELPSMAEMMAKAKAASKKGGKDASQ